MFKALNLLLIAEGIGEEFIQWSDNQQCCFSGMFFFLFTTPDGVSSLFCIPGAKDRVRIGFRQAILA